jgi:hypothetical protein
LLIASLSVLILTCSGSNDNGGTGISAPHDGLIAYYPFNGNANDESGNSNNGTLEAGAVLTTDKNGKMNEACNVNTGFVQIADNNSLDPESFTISIWFTMEAVTRAFNCLIGKDYTTAYAIGIESGGSGDCPAPEGTTREMIMYVGNNGNYFTSSNFSCNTWYHAAVTYNNSTGEAQLYVNGMFVQSTSFPAGGLANSSSPLAIGKDGNASDKFSGIVDEVRIYNRVLSPDEIQALSLAY